MQGTSPQIKALLALGWLDAIDIPIRITITLHLDQYLYQCVEQPVNNKWAST